MGDRGGRGSGERHPRERPDECCADEHAQHVPLPGASSHPPARPYGNLQVLCDISPRCPGRRSSPTGLLDGRVALVTGGGTGLGRAAARELVALRRARWCIAGRREEVLDAAAAELGAGCVIVAGDVRDADDAERIVDAALERHGRLDVLVNNAGGQFFVPAEAIAAKGWRAVHRG